MLYFLLFIVISIIYVLIPFSKINFKIIKIRKYIFPILIMVFLIFNVIYSDSSFKSAHKGFMLWANNVFPALLPFFICIELIKKTNFIEAIGKVVEPIMRPLFNVPGSGVFAIIMGITSGYPVGAKIVSALRMENSCTKTEAERLLAFTNTSGPLFIIGSVGVGMFGDKKIGILLLLTHFISSIIVGFLFRFYHSNDGSIISHNSTNSNTKSPFMLNKLGICMGEAIKNSINTLLLICGYMVFFSVLINIISTTKIYKIFIEIIQLVLPMLGFSKDTACGILSGIFEVTTGISEISQFTTIKNSELLTIVAFILGLGGMSVCMQVNSIIADTDISIKPYIIGKFLQAFIASLLTYIITKYTSFFNWDIVETFSYMNTPISPIEGSSNMLLVSITTIILVCIVVTQVKKHMKQ